MFRSKVTPSSRFPGCIWKAVASSRDYQSVNLNNRHRANSSRRQLSRVGYSRPQFSTMSPDSSIEYRQIDGIERLGSYAPGGYHPVAIDDFLHNRYRMVDKLGFGGYSTIWLARDEIDKHYVAVKLGYRARHSLEES